MAPIAPFGITSFGLSLTPISTAEYLFTTLGAFPFLLLCVYLGSVGGVLVGQRGDSDRTLLGLLALLFTGLTVVVALIVRYLSRWARSARRRGPT